MDQHAPTPESALVIIDSSQEATTALVRAPLPADRHPALVYLAQLSPGSRRTMRTALNTIAELLGVTPVVQETASPRRREVETWLYCDWASPRYPHTLALRTLLAERYKPATANKMLAALRRVLLEARRLGLMSPDDYTQATDISAIKGSSLPPGRALSMGELTALMAVCSADRTAAGPRDAALIALLCRGGLRRSEVVALDLADYASDSGAITVRSGKGCKDRTTYLDGGAAAALADWVALRGGAPGPLLCPVSKGGEITIAPRLPAVTIAAAKPPSGGPRPCCIWPMIHEWAVRNERYIHKRGHQNTFHQKWTLGAARARGVVRLGVQLEEPAL